MTKAEQAQLEADRAASIDYLRTVLPQGGKLYFTLAHTQGRKSYFHRAFVAHEGRIIEVSARVHDIVAPVYSFATGGRENFGIKADVDAISPITARVARALYPDAVEHAESGALRLPITSERL